jgi:hypothetical protein
LAWPVADSTLPEKSSIRAPSRAWYGIDAYLGMAATAALNIKSVQDLIKLARAEPGKYTWSATPGQTAVIVPAFLKLAGIDMLRVSYNNFSMALQDLAQGRLYLAATSLPGGRSRRTTCQPTTSLDRPRSPLYPFGQRNRARNESPT